MTASLTRSRERKLKCAGARRSIFLGVLLAGFTAAAARAESADPREYILKAGILYNLFSYVEWPKESSQPDSQAFVIGIVGDNPFAGAAEQLQGKTVKGRRIEFRQIKDLTRLSDYHIVFVRASEEQHLREVVERTRNTPTLTVGETSEFVREGGVIDLIPAHNRFQIEINAGAADKAGLIISSQLMKLARIIRT